MDKGLASTFVDDNCLDRGEKATSGEGALESLAEDGWQGLRYHSPYFLHSKVSKQVAYQYPKYVNEMKYIFTCGV